MKWKLKENDDCQLLLSQSLNHFVDPRLVIVLDGDYFAVADPPNDLYSPLKAKTYFSWATFKSFMKFSYLWLIVSSVIFLSFSCSSKWVRFLFFKFYIWIFWLVLRVSRAVWSLIFRFTSHWCFSASSILLILAWIWLASG